MTADQKNNLKTNLCKILSAKLCIPESAEISFHNLEFLKSVYLSKEILKAVIEYRMMVCNCGRKLKKPHNRFKFFMKSHSKVSL